MTYAAAISRAVPSKTSSSQPGIPAIGVRMPAVARWVGVADGLTEGAGAAAPGVLAAWLAAGAAVPVTGADAPELARDVPDVPDVVDGAAVALVAADGAVVLDAPGVDPADADCADVGCCAAGVLAEEADRVGWADAAAAVAAAVAAGAAAELLAVVPLAAVLAELLVPEPLVPAAPVPAAPADGAALLADGWPSVASVG